MQKLYGLSIMRMYRCNDERTACAMSTYCRWPEGLVCLRMVSRIALIVSVTACGSSAPCMIMSKVPF